MSDEPRTINRLPPIEPGADYDKLRARAVELIRTMAPQWTDFNFSDPGVTILEQCCYALTELPYRAGLPVAELLADKNGRVPLGQLGLKPASAILPVNPVTIPDLRRLLLDRVVGAGNIWITPAAPACHDGVNGLYELAVLPYWEKRPFDDGCCGGDALLERIRRTYGAHRALCEDIGTLTVLEQCEAWVHSDLQIADGADPAEVLAQCLFHLGLWLAPEPRRHSLDAALAAGQSPSEILDGPLMLRGLIAEDQLTPRPTCVVVDELVEVLARSQGVLSVGRTHVNLAGHLHPLDRGSRAELPKGQIAWLRFTGDDGRFTITLRDSTTRLLPDPGRVRAALSRLWATHRQTFSMREAYAEHFGAPSAPFQDLGAYTSLQTQFPAIYALGKHDLPSDAPPMRRAQVRQLQGFLLPFDQLLADFFAQLAELRSLFTIASSPTTVRGWQSLRGIVPGTEALLGPDYETELNALTWAADPVGVRRNRVLDLLLSLYARPLEMLGENLLEAGDEVVRAKQALLRHAASLSRDRGRGVDLRRPHAVHGRAGLEANCRIELGLLAWLDAAGDATAASGGKAWAVPLPDHQAPQLTRHFSRVTDLGPPPEPAQDDAPALDGLDHQLVEALKEADRYRIGQIDPESTTVFVFCIDTKGTWWWVGEHIDSTAAHTAIHRLMQQGRTQGARADGAVRLHVIDWILLREAMNAQPFPGEQFNFRITGVISARHAGVSEQSWQSQARATLRRHAPAHVLLDCLFLDPAAMHRFEHLLHDWHAAMQGCIAGKQARSSAALVDFLNAALTPQVRPGEPPPDDAADPAPIPRESNAEEPLPHEQQPQPHPEPEQQPVPVPVPEPEPEPVDHSLQPPLPSAEQPGEPPSDHADQSTPADQTGTLQDPAVLPQPAPTPTPTPTPQSAPAAPLPSPASEPDENPQPPQGLLRGRLLPALQRLAFWRHRAAETPEEDVMPHPPTSHSPATVQAARRGALGFDTDTVLNPASAKAFAEHGFVFVVRYLPRPHMPTAGDLSAHEIGVILSTGMALMAVQHVAAPGWIPDAALGTENGICAADYARQIGLPAGVTLWLDLEGVAHGTPASQIMAYCQEWHDAVTARGYRAGLYVGGSCGLDSAQLSATPFRSFWHSGSQVPPLPAGYVMSQSISNRYVIDGVSYDLDTIHDGAADQLPYWLAPS